jgi:hypothetical protein
VSGVDHPNKSEPIAPATPEIISKYNSTTTQILTSPVKHWIWRWHWIRGWIVLRHRCRVDFKREKYEHNNQEKNKSLHF